ncbi:hypothetical protein QYF68_04815 [Mycolicibacterium austroafricanum]|uniref:Uncharacterized protein n=1 Tax=Mycolicibacterium austroafricanum TaxID=39687 RepID=A0ABT8H8S0_MYCAO|nr:hypothetical protein [Mycolicibacterium austroafricanum]MDN4517146.1 hypothetical protein [Mycolicibacterium austroafricanum]
MTVVVMPKLIVAADAPWSGELYSTRPGRDRVGFTSVESFCAAVLAVTGWPLGAQADPADAAPLGRAASRRPKLRRDQKSAARKFIVTASRPWTGEMYRTTPGMGHLHFGTFEQFLRAVMDLTGWSLDHRDYGDRACVASGTGLSRPA